MSSSPISFSILSSAALLSSISPSSPPSLPCATPSPAPLPPAAMDGPREAALRLLGDMKSAGEVAGKTERLKLLLEFLVREQPGLVSEFLPYLLELHTDPSPSTRELVTKIMEEIGSKFPHYATQMVPVLTTTLQDSSPSVAKHTLMAATVIFRTALEQVALQGLDTGQVDKPLQKAWEAIYPIRQIVQNMVLQSTNDGVRLHALKFMESVIMLFTADPTAPSRPPRHRNADVANGDFTYCHLAQMAHTIKWNRTVKEIHI